jgi:hypothetical protein
MSRAIANQLFVAFLGRSVDNQWLSATGNLIASAPSIHTTLGMQQLLYSIAVSEGVYVPSDAAGVYVNKIFQNVFGFAASTQEQTAWGTLINNRTIATEAAPWVIFSSYLGSATVPQTYKFAAQYRLVLAETYTNGLTAADNLALASTTSGIANARKVLTGVNPNVPLTEAAGTLSLTGTLSSNFSVNLALDQVTLGTAVLAPRSGNLANAVNVGLTQLTAETTPIAGSTAPTIVLTGDDQANVLSTGAFATRFTGAEGNDTIVCNSGIDTIVFSGGAVSNGLDRINNFKIGTGGDVLDFSAFLNRTGTANIAVTLATSTAVKAWASGDVLIVQGTGLTATTIAALFAATGTALLAPTAIGKAVIIASDIVGDAGVWFLTNQTLPTTVEAAELTQVATLTGVNNLQLVGLVAANFA